MYYGYLYIHTSTLCLQSFVDYLRYVRRGEGREKDANANAFDTRAQLR